MTSSPLRAALLALPFLVAACGGASSENSTQTPADSSSGAASNEAVADDMVMGSADAPVTVIEYASVTCPHCAAFHETIFPEIKKNYIDTGKVRFIFREFPTAPTGLSYVGSVLARCAAEKGGPDAYFLVLGTLFKTQRTWIYGEDPKLELTKIAGQAGMDEAEFDACMNRQDLVDLINRNVATGSEQYRIDGTPSFVLGGEKLPAVRSAEDMAAKLDEALADIES